MESSLYIVATPIGNLNDISMRAIETLKTVDYIVCEDTRHSKKLLNFYGINKKLIAIHQHNEKNKANEILHLCEKGHSIAYISDAGTPAISDPGAFLVNSFLEAKQKVISIPGASAMVSAFSIAGIIDHHFQFYGFLPNSQKKAKEQLLEVYKSNKTTIIYESPNRVISTMHEILNIFGEQHTIVIARELTKMYESVKKDSVNTLIQFYEKNSEQVKGEFVLIIPPSNLQLEEGEEKILNALKIILQELPLSQSVRLVAAIFNKNKKEVYNLALRLKND